MKSKPFILQKFISSVQPQLALTMRQSKGQPNGQSRSRSRFAQKARMSYNWFVYNSGSQPLFGLRRIWCKPIAPPIILKYKYEKINYVVESKSFTLIYININDFLVVGAARRQSVLMVQCWSASTASHLSCIVDCVALLIFV